MPGSTGGSWKRSDWSGSPKWDNPTGNRGHQGFWTYRQNHATAPVPDPSQASGEWKDGDALFLRCTLWRQPAENVAETPPKGSRVVVTGRLRQRSYETREGEKRTVVEVDVEEIGPSLRYADMRLGSTAHDCPIRCDFDRRTVTMVGPP